MFKVPPCSTQMAKWSRKRNSEFLTEEISHRSLPPAEREVKHSWNGTQHRGKSPLCFHLLLLHVLLWQACGHCGCRQGGRKYPCGLSSLFWRVRYLEKQSEMSVPLLCPKAKSSGVSKLPQKMGIHVSLYICVGEGFPEIGEACSSSYQSMMATYHTYHLVPCLKKSLGK